MGSIHQPNLPVIEFSAKQSNATSSSWATKCVEVTRALEEYGCFILTYDGVSQEQHDAIFLASQELFDLPSEVKVLVTSDTPSFGYDAKYPVIPLYEALCIENATTKHGVERIRKLLWPSGKDSFSESVLMYTKAVAELDQIVMRIVAKNYGIEKHYEPLLGSTTYLLKLIKYISPQGNDPKMGIVPHRDKSFMSILHQDEVNGLEIMTKDGEWIEVVPSPSSFIVMAGDACMAWTNGKIEPSCHRVMMQGNTDRYSLGLFTFIRDLKVETPQELVDENHPQQYKAFDHYKYLHYHATDGLKLKFPLKSYCGI
ncbi:putative 2-oxoglutarate-dependent dioxygenase AOP1 isoform X3 [Bidens hawaiensis]|uniref:putative 2-oxoglutarate-dependent dioxygenase AOP1 isoform X3 n=1 Tax=Bidens hawaiensis TaxID=980011 RepID=UPI00404ADB9F